MILPVSYYGDFLVELFGDELTILSYKGNLKELKIPMEMEGVVVIGVEQGAFNNQFTQNLMKVEVPISIGSIKEGAFSENTKVERYYNHKMGGFEYQSMWIIDPYLDETGRFLVDPLDYYGIVIENN